MFCWKARFSGTAARKRQEQKREAREYTVFCGVWALGKRVASGKLLDCGDGLDAASEEIEIQRENESNKRNWSGNCLHWHGKATNKAIP
jgi:hypothetical protein